MGRLVLASALAMMAVQVAHAGPKRKVDVVTEPSGATIYLNEVETGSQCKSPCKFDAPLGKHTLILTLDKYEPEFLPLDVTKGTGPLPVRYKFKSALGSIVVEAPKGATVVIDDEPAGEAPTRTSVTSTEGHSVVIKVGGKVVFNDFINVATGQQYVVKAPTTRPVASADDTDPVEAPGNIDDDEPITGDTPRDAGPITQRAPVASRGRWFLLGLAVDAGFRRFSYVNATDKDTLRSESVDGQWLGGLAIELWPGRLFKVPLLKGLSLFGRVQVNLYGHPLLGVTAMPSTDPKTVWSSYEGSARYSLDVTNELGFEPSVGFVVDSFAYDRSPGSVVLPQVDYRSIRIGGKLTYDSGVFEPYLAGEFRIGMGGEVSPQFTDVRPDGGFRGMAGFGLELNRWMFMRAEATATAYTWTFGPGSMGPMYAETANDLIMAFSLLAAYTR